MNISPRQPHPSLIGFTGSDSIAERLGFEVGTILKKLGFNMNLAPVLDLADPQIPSFIGLRSFGGNPNLVAQIGYSYSEGLLRAGVIPTGKHFPGLGPINSDPHSNSVVRSEPIKSLLTNDFAPFKKFAELGPNTSMMMSHVIYPSLDEQSIPASFSKKIIKTWLRDQIRFEGLVMTDDLQMRSSLDSFGLSTGAIKSLAAGTDLIMLSWSFKEQEKAYLAVLDAYKRKALSIRDLNSKVERILYVKKFLGQIQQNENSNPRQLASINESVNEASPAQNFSSDEFANINLDAFKKQLDSLQLSTDKKNSLCLYTSQHDFLNVIEKSSLPKMKFFKLTEKTSENALIKSLRSNRCTFNFVTMSTKKDFFLISKIPKIYQKNSVVLNFGLITAFRWKNSFRGIAHFFGDPKKTVSAIKSFILSIHSDFDEKKSSAYLKPDQLMISREQVPEFEVQNSHHSTIQ